MSERIVHVIPNLQMKKHEQKAVGIYARVSTAHSAQLHSVSLQLSALVQQVYHTLNWQLADIYVDFASGKSTFERTEFQRMIEDCRRHKLDLILVKSVSRFSRDTVDALETTCELKRLGIPVYFDLESINSFQPDFELYYSVYAAVAQSERESNHDNLAISMQLALLRKESICHLILKHISMKMTKGHYGTGIYAYIKILKEPMQILTVDFPCR